MSIRLKLEGFDDLLKKIEKAGGSIDKSAEVCLKESADIMQAELKTQMIKAKVDNNLIQKLPPPTLEKNGNAYIARVGYKKGEYNPKNPSDGYKILFLNFGTPKRNPRYGQVKARGFINKAKKKAKKTIKKKQEETLNEILKRLE